MRRPKAQRRRLWLRLLKALPACIGAVRKALALDPRDLLRESNRPDPEGFAAATIKTCNSRIALREEMTAGRCASVDGFIREYSKSRVRGERFAIQFRVNDQRFTLGDFSGRIAYNDATALKPGMRVGIVYCGDEIVRVTVHGN